MLLHLSQWLMQYENFFNVFQYQTLRAILSALTALLVSLLLGPFMIRWLKARLIGQYVRTDGPQSHLSKSGTPTMGGTLVLMAVTLATLLWADLANRYIWVVLFVMLGCGIIGGLDDYQKLILKNSKGLSAKAKYISQSVVGLMAALLLFFTAQVAAETTLYVPFFKTIAIPLGVFFIVLTYFTIVGASNAVNLTDGLDGLAIGPTILVAGGLAIFAYASGNTLHANYLEIPHVPGAGEVAILCAAIVGAGLGFLWFNVYPAQVFMGDVGALALGAALGVIAVIVRQELVLVIMGGIFVLETVSVMLQVASFKLTGKRIFKMAPIHHHFELKGWHEQQVVIRFWIISIVLVLIGLSTLKLR